MSEKLALFGGTPVIDKPFVRYNPLGVEEETAVLRVMRSGVLSKFLGSWTKDFYGGPELLNFEKQWTKFFDVPQAIAVNSATSGLIAAMGAIGIEPGDEVIVSPWTMSATATSILFWGGIPIFSDIEPVCFNLDPKKIEDKITSKTKAIVVTDIFGHPAQLREILAIAKKHGLKVIEDAAQSPGALYHEQYVGTVADIGIFSLNYHKHIHTGEGGVCVTRDSELADRMRLIRNHAEAVVREKGTENLVNMLGYNFRLGEIEAAIGSEQLKKLTALVETRIKAAQRLASGLKEQEFLRLPVTESGCTHVYYIFPLTLETEKMGVDRNTIVDALKAEGVQGLGKGYANIHRLPLYEKKIAFGRSGYPWTGSQARPGIKYGYGTCPNAEVLHDSTLIKFDWCSYEFSDHEVDQVIEAFRKVWRQLPALRKESKIAA